MDEVVLQHTRSSTESGILVEPGRNLNVYTKLEMVLCAIIHYEFPGTSLYSLWAGRPLIAMPHI